MADTPARRRRASTTCDVGRARREDPDADPPRRLHVCSTYHEQVVESYRDAYAAWAYEAETHTIGYATELDEYRKTNPPPLFPQWLKSYRRH